MNSQELKILIDNSIDDESCEWPHAEALEMIAGLQEQLQTMALDLDAPKSQLVAAQVTT